MHATERRFLFLQGPHGPFFRQLARHLRAAGSDCQRIGFNRGDRAFWRDRATYRSFHGPISEWSGTLRHWIGALGITDLVLYGDTRPVHALALEEARQAGLLTHVFEEGYLRPWWITYEREAANGNSPVTRMSVAEMRAMLGAPVRPPVEAPAHWGALRQHMLYGALYHACLLSGGPAIAPHREITVQREFDLQVRRLGLRPVHAAARMWETRRIRRGGFPYHLVLLQLDHDANFRHHSPFPTTEAFLEHAIGAFARGAPRHHHLVMKAHPLEDGRVPLRRLIRRIAREQGVADRAHYVAGGKLAPVLDTARSVITVNSTSAEQALWRGLPVRAFGRAVYAKPEFVSSQPLEAFFADPMPPDREAYAVYRQFLLETSQIPGSFYAAAGRRQLCRSLPDMMLSAKDRYARHRTRGATERQHLRAIGADRAANLWK